MILDLSYKIMHEAFQNLVFKNPHVTCIIYIIHTSKNLKKKKLEMDSLKTSPVGLNPICKLHGLYKGGNCNDFYENLTFSKEISKILHFYR